MGFAAGETIGPYLLIEQLGQGGMATVFKAHHPALDRYVAIKALHPAFTIEPNFLARFRREAQVVAKLEHANIVPIYDYAEHEGRPYLVMKFIEGETLKARLSRGPLSRDETQKIIESVGAALGYAHKQGILHRDVKPSNVLLANDGRIYLADFGLARIAEAGESTISSDVMLGTPQYISPEQAMGRHDLDSGTDIYSFGVVLYEILVGRVPFSADTPYSIIHDHIYTPLPQPRAINPGIPEAVEQVLLKALAKERADRYPDVGTMVHALKEAYQTAELSAIAPPGQQIPPAASTLAASDGAISESAERLPVVEADRIDRPKKHSRWRLAIIIITVLCLCAFVTLVILPRLRPGPQNPQGSAQPTLMSTNVIETATGMLATESAILQPTITEIFTKTRVATLTPLEDARRRVTQNPQDATAHFSLAVALVDAGRYEEADQELNLMIQYAGENMEFYSRLGAQLMLKKSWLLAARLYLQAVEVATEPISEDMSERVNQCLFLAAQEDLFLDMLDRAPQQKVDPFMLDVARARFAFYHNEPAQAESIIGALRTQGATLFELKLLEAEVSYRRGDKDTAIEILENLVQNQDAPRWIRFYADSYLKQINP